MESQEDQTVPIAVIGLSGRFPGAARSPEKLWEMCAAGENAWTPFPSHRLSSEAFYHPDSGRNGSVSQFGPRNTQHHSQAEVHARGGFFLEQDLAHFDAPFFGLNAAEAAVSLC